MDTGCLTGEGLAWVTRTIETKRIAFDYFGNAEPE
jgi:hypothetical protein